MHEDIFKGELTTRKYVNFIWPSVLMMVVLSLYYTIDTIFVANYIGEEGLAAINIAYPLQGLCWGIAVMLAAGSSALVGIELGKGRNQEANERFTFVCVFAVLLGVAFALACILALTPIVNFLGATEVLTEDCHAFLGVFVWGIPAAFLGVIMEFFIRVDGKPIFTIALYVAGGIVHLGLDIVFMGPMHMGLTGAALANILGLVTTALMGVGYFVFADTILHVTKFKAKWKYIGHSFLNGSPELVNEMSGSIMVFFYNIVLIKLAGETGVAAAAIVLQLQYLFMSVFIGYQAGTMPLISYYYGAHEFTKINRVMNWTKKFTIVSSLIMAAGLALTAPLITRIYTETGTDLYDIGVTGLRLAAISLLFVGINVFVSGLFTCFGNGILSAVISLSRGIVMLVVGLYLFSHFFGLTGSWLALTFADVTTLALSFGMLYKYKERYHYKPLG